MSGLLVPAAALATLVCGAGCNFAARLGTDLEGERFGKTFYVGGAGQVLGNTGSWDVPRGLRQGGYRGAIEVFTWQSPISIVALLDQVARDRNYEQARRLTRKIQDYLDEHPGRPVNIVALSAGTGIAAWALEQLDEGYSINSVFFLASSLSSNYDLSKMLEHVNGRVFNLYSSRDTVLRGMVPLTGTVDRQYRGAGVAGVRGLAIPRRASDETRELYLRYVRNMPWMRLYQRFNHFGGHTHGVRRSFVKNIITPLLLRTEAEAGDRPTEADEEVEEEQPQGATTRPAPADDNDAPAAGK